MATRSHSPLVQGLTVAVALTLMSGFVFYRHRGGSLSSGTMSTAPPLDSPETGATIKPVHLDSSYFDQHMPSTKSGMIVPPDHPAFQQPQIRIDSGHSARPLPSSKSAIIFPADEEQRRMLYSSKSGVVFETPPSAIVNDSALKAAKAQDTLK